MVVVLAVVVIAASALSGGGVGKARAPRPVPQSIAGQSSSGRPRPPDEARRLAAAMALGNARIRQLAKLGKPIFCGGHRGHDVAFTFDDGPGVYTYLALRKLRQAHERATFFVVGRSMNYFPGYLPKELKVAAIGDHTYTHPDLLELPPSEVYSQLEQTRLMIQRDSGEHVDLFRPPYGAIDSTVEGIAKRLGLLPIMWTQDSGDSLGANYAGIIKNVESALHPGAIILMHENRGQTIRALTTLLPVLRQRHLRSVSLPELFAADPPSVAEVENGGAVCGPRAGSVDLGAS